MKRVIIVGASEIDGPLLKRQIRKRFDESVVEDVRTSKEALKKLSKNPEKYAVILAMRKGAEDGVSVIDFLDELGENDIQVPLLVVTEYENVISEAEEHGAQGGLKKNLILDGSEEAFSRIEIYFAEED